VVVVCTEVKQMLCLYLHYYNTNFLFFQPLRLFLVASETWLSVISTGSPPLIKYRMGNVYPPARSAKLKIIYGLKLPIWALSYMLRMWLVATLKGGGAVSFQGGANAPPPPPPPPPPLNETLVCMYWYLSELCQKCPSNQDKAYRVVLYGSCGSGLYWSEAFCFVYNYLHY
jgi:hypothetical protein